MNLLQAAGIAAGVVQNSKDLMENDPQLKHRSFYHSVEHPEVGEYRPLRPGVLLSKVQCDLKPSPLLGEHNEYVYKDLMGLNEDEIAELVIDGIIE
jgi:crotonobetainyl-CoA:carnitine CoA-transferase CaiB-like acyl-CoA transferase